MKMNVCGTCGTEIGEDGGECSYEYCRTNTGSEIGHIVEVNYSGIYIPLDLLRETLSCENAVISEEDVDPLIWGLYGAVLRSGLHGKHRNFIVDALRWMEDTMEIEETELPEHDRDILKKLIGEGKTLLDPDRRVPSGS